MYVGVCPREKARRQTPPYFFVNLGGFSVENGIEKRASLSKKRIFTPNVSKRGKFLIVVYIF